MSLSWQANTWVQFVCPRCSGEEFKVWKSVTSGWSRAICVHCLSWTELRPGKEAAKAEEAE